jgi:O-antigen/teichoic acid export membrane protein
MQLTRQFKLNTLYNFGGLGLPLIAALVSIPYLIAQLGEAKFGLLTLIWAVVSYFGLFDLGLGRAVTQQYARAVGDGEDHRLGEIVASANLLLLILGVLSAALLLFAAPLLSAKLIDGAQDIEEVTRALWFMAAAMPFIILTSGFRGVLEAQQRFALINMIRVPMGLFTYLAPMAVVLAGYKSLDVMSFILAWGRVVGCGVHAYFALRDMRHPSFISGAHRSSIFPLLTTGGWMTVSNVISPLMTYLDRFLIGFVAGTAAVAYYVTPQEMVMRLAIIPAAITGALFPMFAQSPREGALSLNETMIKYSLQIGAIMLPLALMIMIFAELILSIWISREFAKESYLILQILTLASVLSGIAQAPYTLLQSQGRARDAAIVHTIELPLYCLLLMWAVWQWGAIGAAFAWLARISFDAGAMLVLSNLRFSAEEKFES